MKYSEHHAVKLKQDIGRLTTTLNTLGDEKKARQAELARLNDSIALAEKDIRFKHDVVMTLDQQTVDLESAFAVKEQALNEQFGVLVAKNKLLEQKIQILQKEAELVEKQNRESERRQATEVKSAEKTIQSLSRRIEREQTAISKLEKLRDRLTEEIDSLEEERLTLDMSNIELDLTLQEKIQELVKLTTKEKEAQARLKDIESREHNVKVMEMRLTPEYKKIYQRRTNRRGLRK